MGLEYGEQREILKKAKITNYDEVLRGRFQPIKPQRDLIIEEQLKGKPIPQIDLLRIRRELDLKDLEGKFRGSQNNTTTKNPVIRTSANNQQTQDRVSIALRQAEIDKLLGIT